MPLLGFFFFYIGALRLISPTITLNRAFHIPDAQTRHQLLPNQTDPSLNSLNLLEFPTWGRRRALESVAVETRLALTGVRSLRVGAEGVAVAGIPQTLVHI